MEKIKKKSGYDTNLAAEFYVMSCLHRLGITGAASQVGVQALACLGGGHAEA
jgi:hypothetical protein